MLTSRWRPRVAGPPNMGRHVLGLTPRSQLCAYFPGSELGDIREELDFHLSGRICTADKGRCCRLSLTCVYSPPKSCSTADSCLLGPLQDAFPGWRALGTWGVSLRAASGGPPSIPGCPGTGMSAHPAEGCPQGALRPVRLVVWPTNLYCSEFWRLDVQAKGACGLEPISWLINVCFLAASSVAEGAKELSRDSFIKALIPTPRALSF